MSHSFGYGSSQKGNKRWVPEREGLPGYASELDEFVVSTEEHVTDASWSLAQDTFTHGRNSAQSVRNSNTERKRETSGSLTIENPMSSHLHRSSVIKPLPLEWYTFRINSTMVGFDLELWWRRSPRSTRIAVFVALFLVVIAFINLVAGIAFIILDLATSSERDNPYICPTKECHEASKWMTQTMNMSVKPCDNFYEFVCGNTEESLNEVDGFFKRYINTPGYKIEFGENSILAKILRNYKENDTDYNLPIQFYQACLNERNRRKYGLSAFREKIEYVLETTDAVAFEKSSITMEEVGARMFRVMGHAVYLTMGFYSYPYIQRTVPIRWIGVVAVDSKVEQPLTKIVEHIMLEFGYPKDFPGIIKVSEGIYMMAKLVERIIDIHLGFPPSDFEYAINKYLMKAGFCPPMGINVNVNQIFELFLGGSYKTVYSTDEAKVFANVLQRCFDENPSNFDIISDLEHPRFTLAMVWVVGLFIDLVPDIGEHFVSQMDLDPTSWLTDSIYDKLSSGLEYRCLVSMWRNLGYLPTARYIQSIMPNPMTFIEEKEREIRILFQQVKKEWLNIPECQIWEHEHFIGKLVFGRDIHADVVLPVNGDQWDASVDALNLTDDPLRNSIISVQYTVEKSLQYWLGSTDSVASIKWWADGGWLHPVSDRESLLSFQKSFVLSPKFEEKYNAAGEGRWVKFLNRVPMNYILFTYSLFNQPHTTETLALENGGITFKTIRTILTLVLEAFAGKKYPQYSRGPQYSPENLGVLNVLGYLYNYTQYNYACTSFDNPVPGELDPTLYDYAVNPAMSLEAFSWGKHFELMNTLAVKFSLKHFNLERKELHELPFGWDWELEKRNHRMHRFLPGVLSKYSEKQILLIALVRQNCRGSWKKFNDTTKRSRYFLETVILNMMMQTEEFSEVWECPSGSLMNLDRDKRCLNYVP